MWEVWRESQGTRLRDPDRDTVSECQAEMLATCEPVTKGTRLKKLLMLPSDKSLGGVHSSQVRKLLLQKLRQENETLHQPKAMYFDFQFAKAEAYYYRHQETVLGEAWKYKMVPGWDIKIERERDRTVKTQEMLKNGTV